MNNLSPVRMNCARQTFGAFLLPLAVILAAGPAAADPLELEASAGLSSMLIDRGETLATLNNEIELIAAKPTDWGGVYGALYRISPIGADTRAFDEEVDYTIGLYTELEHVALDVSANYLTFPGSSEEASLELGAELGFSHAWEPGLAAFYDVDLDVYGVEAFAGPSTDLGAWTLGVLGRAGFVSSDAGDYSYAGLESVAGRDLNRAVSLEAFIRLEAADEDTFADRVENGAVTAMTSQGAGIGVRLTARR